MMSVSRFLLVGLVLLLLLPLSYHSDTRTSTLLQELEQRLGKEGENEGPGLPPEALEQRLATFQDPATHTLPAGMRQRELAFARRLPRHTYGAGKAQRTSLFEWVEAGPDRLGGRAQDVVVDVTDPQTVLVGSASGGIWKTTDQGATWRLVSDVNEQWSFVGPGSGPSTRVYPCLVCRRWGISGNRRISKFR